jgi:hypothetical protein
MGTFNAATAVRECLTLHLGDWPAGAPDAERLHQLVLQLYDADVPVEFAFVRRDATTAEPRRHRQAAVEGMRLIARRLDCYFERLALAERSTRATYMTLTIDESRLAGERVDVEQFFGDGFDVVTGELTATGNQLMNVERKGFAYAFCTAPHGVRNADRLLRTTIEEALDRIPPDVAIWQWNDDWSNYFDAGKEWWGTFCWTIEIPRQDRIIFAVASTTD